MKKISLLLLAFSMLFCACSKEDDDYIKLSQLETKQYSQAIAGSYEAKGYTFLVAHKDFYNSDVIGKNIGIDDIFIDIDAKDYSMIFWNIPINNLANLLPGTSGARKVLEKCEPISFTTIYGFERTITSVKGEKMVNLAFKPVPFYLTTTYDGNPHLITINVQPHGIYLPYTSDMKAIREDFLKSEIRFDITSMKIDDMEYKNFDLVVVTEISTVREL